MATDLVAPTRIRIRPGQIAPALAAAGILPTRACALPLEAGAAEPLGDVAAPGGGVAPASAAALDAVARPTRMLSVVVNSAGRDTWTEIALFSRASSGPFVIQGSGPDGAIELVSLPTLAQAVVVVDDLARLTAMPAPPGSPSVELTVAGLTALLALADLIQAARLRAAFDRATFELPEITAAALEEQLANGIRGADTRWAITAGRHVMPADIRALAGRLGAGLEEIRRAGLVPSTAAELTPAGAPYPVVSALTQIVATAGLTAARDDGGDALPYAQAAVFRTSVGIWIVAWKGAGDALAADVFQVDAVGALELVRKLLESEGPDVPVPAVPSSVAAAAGAAPRFCAQCGHALTAGARFCGSCGKEVSR